VNRAPDDSRPVGSRTLTADRCLWWDTAARLPLPHADLPDRADVAVIGGGYTGLAAARALARAGASVIVLEREHIGWGASSRNGGMVLPGFKAELADLVTRLGLPRARVLFRESLEALEFVEALVREERIACDWRRSGHGTLAAKPQHLRALEATRRLLDGEFGYQTQLLDAAGVRTEVGSTRYHGALMDPGAASLDPAAFVAGLGTAARRAGATLCEGTEVQEVARTGAGCRLTTSRGELAANEVVIATNGYTGRLLPWLRRRVVPVGSYIIATERLDPAMQRRLIPWGRTLSDTWNLLHYFRLSPDGRLVFGGRAAFVPAALERSVTILHREMVEIFPDLGSARVEYAWGGTLGFTLDHMPHVGRHDGIAYALGYCGHGVAWATWLGDRVGAALAGKGDWPELADAPFRPIPFNWGRPWFLPLAGAYYGLKDRLT
jgi:glycine/D-amino acid oxidase-like deaminating enzyme